MIVSLHDIIIEYGVAYCYYSAIGQQMRRKVSFVKVVQRKHFTRTQQCALLSLLTAYTIEYIYMIGS